MPPPQWSLLEEGKRRAVYCFLPLAAVLKALNSSLSVTQLVHGISHFWKKLEVPECFEHRRATTVLLKTLAQPPGLRQAVKGTHFESLQLGLFLVLGKHGKGTLYQVQVP